MTGFTELTLTCPHCGVSGKPQPARVSTRHSGLGWAVCDEQGNPYERRGLVTCDSCKAAFAYEVDAIPVVRVARVNW